MLSIILLKDTVKEWKSTVVNILTEQIYSSERRIRKGINENFEKKRFHNSSEALENFAIKLSNDENTLVLDSIMTSHVMTSYFSLKKVPFILMEDLSKIFDLNDEITKHYSAGIFISKPFSDFKFDAYLKKEIEKVYFNSDDFDVKIFDTIKLEGDQEVNLLKKIKEALIHKKGIGKQTLKISRNIDDKNERKKEFSKVRHTVITKVLRELAYKKTEITQKPYVRYGYNDGSVGGRINIFQLEYRDLPTNNIKLYDISLISNRHYELDDKIDFCFLRNIEINGRDIENSAHQESEAYNRVHEQINEMLDKNSKIIINLYHTGLEPAIIGTYRAIIDIKLSREDIELIIEPFITEEFKLKTWN